MIRLILAEDHVVVRNGLKSILEREDDIEVVAEADNGLEVLSALSSGLQADVVLTDISMPEMDGMTLAGEIQKKYRDVRVMILSMLDNEKYIFEAFNLGIQGYMLKNTSVEELLFAIRHVFSGKQVICMDLALMMLKRAARAYDDSALASFNLSARELEVLALIADGYTNQEIADQIFTSRRTVEGHRQHLIDKAGVKNTAQLITFACKNGLI